jgi:putative redox protein
MSNHTASAPIVVTHDGGLRFAAQIRSHRVVVDQPARSGGEDVGPSPIELLGASLGTCVAFYVQQFCHARGLAYEGLRVEVEQRGAANPSRIGQFAVRVILPGELPWPYWEMLERVARSCPAHNTLTQGAEVTVMIESAVAVA